MARTKNGDKVIRYALILPLLLFALAGCASYQSIARQQGFSNEIVLGKAYLHRVMANPLGRDLLLPQRAPQAPPRHWHVYIEGDGRAVDAWGHASYNPTPRSPLLLDMMAQDPAPALYLGRPCYFDTRDDACTQINWTLARYSEETVESMAAALASRIPAQDSLTLIGHSGGGTLAVLLAARVANVAQVVTLAGNLEVNQWTTYHHYSPLSLSLDPAKQPPLSGDIRQTHLAGALDTEILPQWIEEFAKNQPNAHFQALEQADHRSGWPLWWTLINIESTIKSQ